MGLARGTFHPPGDHGEEGAPSINGSCSAIPVESEKSSSYLTLRFCFSVRSLGKGGGIATCVLLAESSTSF